MSPTPFVETVTGRIPIDRLGRTLTHEHIFISYAGAEFDTSVSFDRSALVREAVRRLVELRERFGVETFVDPCPIDLGRDVSLMKEVSEKSGMHIVCTTGFYFDGKGLLPYWRARSIAEIAEFFIHELKVGIQETSIRAGAIKVATGGAIVTDAERKFIAAACIAQRETGVPIITHTEGGVGGPEQQQLFSSYLVKPACCLIGHCCGNPNYEYHRQIAAGGNYVGFDRIGGEQFQKDTVRVENLVRLIKDGFGAQVIMSMDRFCGWRGKMARQRSPEEVARINVLTQRGEYPPPHTHLFTSFIPSLLERGISPEQIDSILVRNPRGLFSGSILS